MNLYAILQGQEGFEAARVPLTADLQQALTEDFDSQRAVFRDDHTELIEYQPGYVADDDELMVIDGFEVPDFLGRARNAGDVIPVLTAEVIEAGAVRGIVASERLDRGPATLMFQVVQEGHLIKRTRRFVFLSGETFDTADRAGLRLDKKIAALLEGGKLYFRSDRTISRFLPLEGMFDVASDEQVDGFLRSQMWICEDVEGFKGLAGKWARRKISEVERRGLLQQLKLTPLARVAKEYGLELATRRVGGRLRAVVPTDSKDLKTLLRVICDDSYTGALSKIKYVTNSKRVLRP